jgi:hypothetical protein
MAQLKEKTGVCSGGVHAAPFAPGLGSLKGPEKEIFPPPHQEGKTNTRNESAKTYLPNLAKMKYVVCTSLVSLTARLP